jgi:hypothetical protein
MPDKPSAARQAFGNGEIIRLFYTTRRVDVNSVDLCNTLTLPSELNVSFADNSNFAASSHLYIRARRMSTRSIMLRRHRTSRRRSACPPSDEVLEQLAGALELDAAAREVLFLLAQQRPPPLEPSPAPLVVTAALQRMLDALPA